MTSEAPIVHGLNIFRKIRRKRVGGGALYALIPRAFFQAAGGFLDRVVVTDLLFCIEKHTRAGQWRGQGFPNLMINVYYAVCLVLSRRIARNSSASYPFNYEGFGHRRQRIFGHAHS